MKRWPKRALEVGAILCLAMPAAAWTDGPMLWQESFFFDALSKGCDQIRHNLYYLTARCRMASSQALPDPELYQAGLLILGQVQQLQLSLNSLYLDAVAARQVVADNRWSTDKYFRHRTEELLRNVVRIQDSVFL